jgi:hypothetical protein
MEGLLNAHDRLLQAQRMRQNPVAFAPQALDQRADAYFVVVIGALERGDFAFTIDSSSEARATARSTPSPNAAISRRIAWPMLTKASEETPSGSAKRMVISVIAAAT